MSNGILIELNDPLQSGDVTELNKALAQFSSMVQSVTVDATGKVEKEGRLLYTYNYATLAHILEDIREPLQACKLSVTQDVFTAASGNPAVVTTVLHESGQWRRSRPLVIPAAGHKPQDYGSSISYARRYQLNGMLNLAIEDTDGPVQTGKQAKPGKAEDGTATDALKSRARENVQQVTTDDATTRMSEIDDAKTLTSYMNSLPAAVQKVVRKNFKARLDALKAH